MVITGILRVIAMNMGSMGKAMALAGWGTTVAPAIMGMGMTGMALNMGYLPGS